MDALALLCNLYADGPASLKRLREAGCASFESLEEYAPEQLATILACKPGAAQRFLREARYLIERIGADALDQEDPAREQAAEQEEPVLVAPTVGLEPHCLDGLDSELCSRLATAEVANLEQLVAADPVRLSQSSGIGFTRILHLQFLARRTGASAIDLVGVAPEGTPAALETEAGKLSPAAAQLHAAPPVLEQELAVAGMESLGPVLPPLSADPEAAAGPFA